MSLPVGDIACSFRDPIHGMIPVNSAELEVVRRSPFQRLRSIRQLGTTYKVYHGAEHTRFGHSLGMMFLVSRVMDTLRSKAPLKRSDEFERLKQIVRLAGLMHDLGHGPFSHVGEEIFPDGQTHEEYCTRIIRHFYGDIFAQPLMKDLGISVGDVTSLLEHGAPDKHLHFVNNLVSGQLDADKMDYLLRDAHYCGVNYGRYDLERLIDTLRVCVTQNDEWLLGVESNGVHAVEEFVFARYWMFLQVYFHKTRRILDHYLVEYMKHEFGVLPSSLPEFLAIEDNEVLRRMSLSSDYWASRLNERRPMKEVFVSKPHYAQEQIDRFTGRVEEFQRRFPDPGGKWTYIDRACSLTTREMVNIRSYAGDADQPDEQEIPAIPVVDKHLMGVRPIQEYSIPIQGLTGKNINVLRIYADIEYPGMEMAVSFWADYETRLEAGRRKWGGES